MPEPWATKPGHIVFWFIDNPGDWNLSLLYTLRGCKFLRTSFRSTSRTALSASVKRLSHFLISNRSTSWTQALASRYMKYDSCLYVSKFNWDLSITNVAAITTNLISTFLVCVCTHLLGCPSSVEHRQKYGIPSIRKTLVHPLSPVHNIPTMPVVGYISQILYPSLPDQNIKHNSFDLWARGKTIVPWTPRSWLTS